MISYPLTQQTAGKRLILWRNFAHLANIRAIDAVKPNPTRTTIEVTALPTPVAI
jgi:hypothetical protein